MTDNRETELQSLIKAEESLRRALSRLTEALDSEGADPPDKTARAISTVMKALDDIAEKRERITAQEQVKKYTRYEDMPPPSPEDEKRFYENFKRLFHVVATDYRAGPNLPPDT